MRSKRVVCLESLQARILRARGPGPAEGLQEALCARYTACVALALEYLHTKERKDMELIYFALESLELAIAFICFFYFFVMN